MILISFFHVVFGTAALLMAPAALVARKGSAWHRRLGLTFILTMSVVLLTACFMWESKGHVFLVPLAIVTAYLLFNGFRSIARRRRRTRP